MDYEEATFTDTKKAKAAPLPAIQLPRHPLMVGVNSEAVERAQQDVMLSMELGLKGQAHLEAGRLVKSDYDTLAEKHGYIEVNEKDLWKLFSMTYLTTLCMVTNVFRIIQRFVPAMAFICASVLIAKFFPPNWFVWSVFGVSIASGIIALIIAIKKIMDDDFHDMPFGFMNVELKSEEISRTQKPIPYGAKLRLKEAIDSGVFSNFIISYPHVSKVERPPRLDPAICGVAGIEGEEVWYLITFWDIEKDVERAKASIMRRARNLKLKK